MSKAVNKGLRALTMHYKAYGHDCKGRGKRLASKCRRRLDKAICQGE